MPGWWYTIESTTTKHLIDQFEHACCEALSSDRSTREVMRSISAKQRFPVIEWIRRLDKLQNTAIKMCDRSKRRPTTPTRYSLRTSFPLFGTPHKSTGPVQVPATEQGSSGAVRTRGNFDNTVELEEAATDPNAGQAIRVTLPRNASSPSLSSTLISTVGSSGPSSSTGDSSPDPSLLLGSRLGPGHASMKQIQSSDSLESLSKRTNNSRGDSEDQTGAVREGGAKTPTGGDTPDGWGMDSELRYDDTPDSSSLSDYDPQRGSVLEIYPIEGTKPPMPTLIGPNIYQASEVSDTQSHSSARPGDSPYVGALSPAESSAAQRSTGSRLSLASVLGAREEFALSNVEEIFTDANGKYLRQFCAELRSLDAKSLKDEHCIEEFIMRSEKEWANTIRSKKLGVESLFNYDLKSHFLPKTAGVSGADANSSESSLETQVDDMSLSPNRPTGLKLFLQRRIGEWPLYSFLISLVSVHSIWSKKQGQVIAANSFQLTLLTDQSIQSALQLYVLASIYLVTSVIWWYVFRRFQAIYCLSIPFYLYGLAFFLIGLPSFSMLAPGRTWINNVGTACYAVASSSGSLFFALNFADESGAPVTTWVFRACVIQGIQQAFAAGLWYWGHSLAALTAAGMLTLQDLATSTMVTIITWPIAALLVLVGLCLFFGLPDYYRRLPGGIPAFYKSLTRRKLVLVLSPRQIY
jgi:alpha-1,3-glucan synthase